VTDCHHARGDDPVELPASVDPAELLHAIEAAFAHGVRRTGGSARDVASDHTLRAAVEAARDAGVPWGRIADALDTRRGNAYQRYRRRQGPTEGTPPR
jgi:hypothetical protein